MADIKLVGQAERFMLMKVDDRGWIVIVSAAFAVVEKNVDFWMTLIPADSLRQILMGSSLDPFFIVSFRRSIRIPFSESSGVPRIAPQWSSTICSRQF